MTRSHRPTRTRGFTLLEILVVVLIAGVAPFSKTFIEHWSRRDVEARSRLVYNAIQGPVSHALATGDMDRLGSIFDGVAQDNRILAVGLCDPGGRLLKPTKLMPPTFSCDNLPDEEAGNFSTLTRGRQNILVGTFPLAEQSGKAHLVILHDLSFIDVRSDTAQTFVALTFAGFAVVIAGIAAIFVFFMLRGWMRSLQMAVEDVRRRANG